MVFNKGDIVYSMAIRFWEDKEPIKCVVETNTKTKEVNLNMNSDDSIYVYSDFYKHNVYIDRKKCFHTEEKCREAIEIYSKLNELYFNDELDEICKRSVTEMRMKD